VTTVLIVDDRAVNRDLVRTVLGYHGYDVVEARDGFEAVSMLSGMHPDLVVADVLMPGMDGYQLARAIRADPQTRNIPVVFYTANYVESEIGDIARAVGVERIVTKSGDLSELLDAVHDTLGTPPAPLPVPAAPEESDREHLSLLNAKLVQKVAELEQATRQRVTVLEDRNRIARDLHDVVIQRLFGLGLGLQRLRADLPEHTAAALGQVIEELDGTIDEIRNTIFSLRVPDEGRSVRAAVMEIVRSAALDSGAPRLRFDGPVDTAVPARVRAHLLATLTEALSNVRRHAGASRVEVLVRVDAETLTLRVTDNGRGLPAKRTESGLANLRQRAAELGGAMQVGITDAADGTGTVLSWVVPLPGPTLGDELRAAGLRGSVRQAAVS
jgi:signal transduction histidine kinase